jgi:hypothetical protein
MNRNYRRVAGDAVLCAHRTVPSGLAATLARIATFTCYSNAVGGAPQEKTGGRSRPARCAIVKTPRGSWSILIEGLLAPFSNREGILPSNQLFRPGQTFFA